MATEKRLMGYDPITFESFTRHMTKHREPYDQYDMGYVDAADQIEDWLEANTVDAVEVVRCKDCVHYEYGKGYAPWCNHMCGLDEMGEDDYCSYGERKENDHWAKSGRVHSKSSVGN